MGRYTDCINCNQAIELAAEQGINLGQPITDEDYWGTYYCEICGYPNNVGAYTSWWDGDIPLDEGE